MKNEIILYQSNELPERIEVRIEDDTVWLTQLQMAALFMQTKQNVSLHINNCFKDNELQKISVVKESLTTEIDGKKYKTKYYNFFVYFINNETRPVQNSFEPASLSNENQIYLIL